MGGRGKKHDKQKKTCARVYVAATEGSENQEAYDGASPVVITSRYGERGSCDMCEKKLGGEGVVTYGRKTGENASCDMCEKNWGEREL